MRSRPGRRLAFFLFLGLSPGLLCAKDVLTIAVASNFARTAAQLTEAFTAETHVEVRISPGSTGKLYAQILNGAPYDVFLAADAVRPLLLEENGHTLRESRMTYATGSLVLWSGDERLRGRDCREVLEQGAYGRLALANPATAPYGAAAREFLVAEGLWDSVARQAVYGENISQTMQFVATGNASLGFIAKTQTTSSNLPAATCSWEIPESLHAPLHQQGVILARARHNNGARRFFEFLQSEKARQIIRQQGYRVPN